MELYTLAENCNYGDLTSEMMRDRLVVGIQDERGSGGQVTLLHQTLLRQ